jgi:hypothetical protein
MVEPSAAAARLVVSDIATTEKYLTDNGITFKVINILITTFVDCETRSSLYDPRDA